MNENRLFASVDYEEFLSRHDMIWDRFPDAWDDAPFLGNGLLGAMIYRRDERSLRMDMGHALVYDHRTRVDASGRRVDQLFNNCRLPIGHFSVTFDEPLVTCDMRLDLYNACVSGRIGAGNSVAFQGFVHTNEMLFFVQFDSSTNMPRIEFVPEKAESPRQTYGNKYNEPARTLPGYRCNPKPEMFNAGNVSYCVQRLDNDWQTVTAWGFIPAGQGALFAATVTHGQGNSARDNAVKHISELTEQRYLSLLNSHKQDWNSFYRKSFLSISDAALESFYWIQMYKLHSATRKDLVVMDNQGPWLQETPWPGIWWNLNVQLAYSPVFAANQYDHFDSVWKALERYENNLINNVSEPFRHDSAGIATASDYELNSSVQVPGEDKPGMVEIGNLIWVLHGCYQYYKMDMNKDFLLGFLFPMLKRAVAYPMHFVFERDGELHIMATSSPEYGVKGEDANYELTLLKWGLQVLTDINNELGLNDPSAGKWAYALSRLTDYPLGENGYLIAKDVPYAKSHRHYSHIMMAYPFYLVNREQPGASEVIEKTIRHWQSLKEHLQGYSFTGAASLYAALGDGDNALKSLRGLWGGFLRRNTLYKESGPVIETPLSAARSIQDMLLQSWGGKIRVFPAVPTEWADVAFDNMRAEGAFAVSALRTGGKTRFVRIKSLCGEPCVLECDTNGFKADNESITITRAGRNDLRIRLKAGEVITLHAPDYAGGFDIAPVSNNADLYNCYGFNGRTSRVINNPKDENRI